MKKIFTSVLFTTLTFLSIQTFATKIIVTAENYKFTPDSFDCNVGDTITWHYTGGFGHEPASTTIPNGAATWTVDVNSGSPDASYVVTVSGTYNYVCNFHIGDGMVGKFIAHPAVSTNITALPVERPIKVFPSPFHNTLTIDLNQNTSFKNEVTVELTNSIGERKIATTSREIFNNAITLDVSDLAQGMYFVTISDGNLKKTYRVIKSE